MFKDFSSQGSHAHIKPFFPTSNEMQGIILIVSSNLFDLFDLSFEKFCIKDIAITRTIILQEICYYLSNYHKMAENFLLYIYLFKKRTDKSWNI